MWKTSENNFCTETEEWVYPTALPSKRCIIGNDISILSTQHISMYVFFHLANIICLRQHYSTCRFFLTLPSLLDLAGFWPPQCSSAAARRLPSVIHRCARAFSQTARKNTLQCLNYRFNCFSGGKKCTGQSAQIPASITPMSISTKGPVTVQCFRQLILQSDQIYNLFTTKCP